MILLQVLSKEREDLTKYKLQEEVQDLCETEKISEYVWKTWSKQWEVQWQLKQLEKYMCFLASSLIVFSLLVEPTCLQQVIIDYYSFLMQKYKRNHSFSSLSYDRSKASSKASSPHSAIQSFLLQMRVSSPFLKVIQ